MARTGPLDKRLEREAPPRSTLSDEEEDGECSVDTEDADEDEDTEEEEDEDEEEEEEEGISLGKELGEDEIFDAEDEGVDEVTNFKSQMGSHMKGGMAAKASKQVCHENLSIKIGE